MIFAALLAIFVLLAFSEFVGLVPDRLGSVGRMNDLLGVLAIFFVVLSFGAMAWPAAVNRFFRRPLEREYRKLAKRASRSTRGARAGEASRRGGSSPATEDSNHEAFYAHLTARICTIDDQADTSPARLIATARQSTTESAEWPWQLPELAAWAQHSEERLRSNIVIRFLLGERLATVSERLKTLRGYALSFPVAPPGLAEQHATLDSDQYAKRRASRALATAIEAHSGASLLATGLHTRAGVDTVRLWHSDSILSQQESGSREPSQDNYTEHHLTTRIPDDGASETTSSSCTWEQAMQESSYYLVGDRDNHVPIVDGVTVSENRWAGSVEFVLSTHSSCMAATDHSPFACKGPAAALGTGETPLWEEVSRVVKRRYTSESVLESNLAVHVAMVVTDEHNERHLVLVRRSNTFRFGNRMLTMPSETLTLAAGGKRGYTDVHGKRRVVARGHRDGARRGLPAEPARGAGRRLPPARQGGRRGHRSGLDDSGAAPLAHRAAGRHGSDEHNRRARRRRAAARR